MHIINKRHSSIVGLLKHFRVYECLTIWLAIGGACVYADGLLIDVIEHPYVYAYEQELEFNYTHAKHLTNKDYQEKYQLAYGKSINDRFFTELSLSADKDDRGGFDVSAYEVEIKSQLNEQGEHWIDLGVLFEYEREYIEKINELAVVGLLEKEWSKISAAANVALRYEWGGEIANEFESSAALQVRYRYQPYFEPAIELFLGEDTHALGPHISGRFNLSQARKIRWESALIFGLDEDSPDASVKMSLEYEF